MQRYFLEVSYNGTAFHGSQLQGDTPTVQLELNKALSLLLREEVISFGASRTDEGVHALSAFYHFDTLQELHPHLEYKLNAILPAALAVTGIFRCADPEFNARFDAISRTYRYRIYFDKNPFYKERALYYPFRLQDEVLHETAAVLRNYRDFESFSKRNTQSKTFVCTISESRWERHGDQLHYVVTANRFLRGMVRGLVGTQLQIARGKGDVSDFISIIEARDCTKADFSVAGHGLYLEKISYEPGKLERLNLK
ncbi:MAG: tRNA pseudouridine synthase A [Sphingobacteriales bacterium]|nr:MAG: tRNA pseudouridine synthase A [Sphingobacteriales bacterium]